MHPGWAMKLMRLKRLFLHIFLSMNPLEFYNPRLQTLQLRLKQLQRQKSLLAWARLAAIILVIFVFYVLLPYSLIWIIVIEVVLLAAFVRLVYSDLRCQSKIKQTAILLEINEEEIKSLEGDYLFRDSGIQFLDKEHPYTNDLDIFGRASLYQYINRTYSEMGNSRLASFLSKAASIEEITERQAASKELSQHPSWMQELQLYVRSTRITSDTQKKLDHWLQEPPIFLKNNYWKWLRYVIPSIVLTIIGLFIYDVVGYPELILTLLISGIIAYRIDRYAAPVHEQLSKVAAELSILSDAIAQIEKFDPKSELLIRLKKAYYHNGKSASMDIRKIRKVLDRMDLRYNMVLGAPLNVLLLWNLQQVLDLEHWKKDHPDHINNWFDSLAAYEALSSFGCLMVNHPDWTLPSISENYFQISGKEIGHPLILAEKRVNNWIDIPDRDHLMIITGSNMAGKSTYLRSIGINVVLALAGAPVCAQSFSLSHVMLISSMRVTDNLEENTSTFYAELKKLKTIIDLVNQKKPVFILLDEILRGTNSMDRHVGSKALIKQFIRQKAVAVIATHDLELAQPGEEYDDNILSFHFDVQVSNEELYFDYRLKTGICTSLNASILMKKIGIELE